MGADRQNTKRAPGFSLIELIIVIAIIGIISAVTLASLRNSRTQNDVWSNARLLAATIREAQNFALAGKNINATGNVPCEFHVTVTGGVYKVEQKSLAADGSCPATYAVAGTSAVFVNGVSLSSGTTEIRFKVPRAEPMNAAGVELTSGFIDFAIMKGGISAHVCVYSFGRVEEQPTAC